MSRRILEKTSKLQLFKSWLSINLEWVTFHLSIRMITQMSSNWIFAPEVESKYILHLGLIWFCTLKMTFFVLLTFQVFELSKKYILDCNEKVIRSRFFKDHPKKRFYVDPGFLIYIMILEPVADSEFCTMKHKWKCHIELSSICTIISWRKHEWKNLVKSTIIVYR